VDSQTVSMAQFVDSSGNVRVFQLADLVSGNQDALINASPDAPIALFADGSGEVTGTVAPAGGEYAIRYALTGSLFEAPPTGGGDTGGGSDGNHTPSGDVGVAGTASEDQTLTADTSSVADEDGLGTMSYQWSRSTDGGVSWNDIGGATGASYAL